MSLAQSIRTYSLSEMHETISYVNYCHELSGARMAKYLHSCSPQLVNTMVLSYKLNTGCYSAFPDECQQVSPLLEEIIPLGDYQTLREICREMNKIVERIAISLEYDLSVAKYEAELDTLKYYYRQYMGPNSAFRHFKTTEEKSYHANLSALTRFLNKAKIECPIAYMIVKNQVKCGLKFCWTTFNIRQ